jgi:hypothetical protein
MWISVYERDGRIMMKSIAVVGILTALSIPLTATRVPAADDYRKICQVDEELRVLDDDADADSCRAVAVDFQAREYQIGCRDSENKGPIIVTAPFKINDKGATVTSSKLAANTRNTASPEQFAKCAKAWGNR